MGGRSCQPHLLGSHRNCKHLANTSAPLTICTSWAKNEFLQAIFSVFVTYFAHSKMPLVTCNKYEGCRIFWALWRVTYELNKVVQYINSARPMKVAWATWALAHGWPGVAPWSSRFQPCRLYMARYYIYTEFFFWVWWSTAGGFPVKSIQYVLIVHSLLPLIEVI